MLKKLINYYRNVAGYLVQIRVEPPEFRKAEREAAELIDADRNREALDFISGLPLDWQNDPDFIRLSTFARFGLEDDERLGPPP